MMGAEFEDADQKIELALCIEFVFCGEYGEAP